LKRESEVLAEAIQELAEARKLSQRKICSIYLEELLFDEIGILPVNEQKRTVLDSCPICNELIGKHDRKK